MAVEEEDDEGKASPEKQKLSHKKFRRLIQKEKRRLKRQQEAEKRKQLEEQEKWRFENDPVYRAKQEAKARAAERKEEQEEEESKRQEQLWLEKETIAQKEFTKSKEKEERKEQERLDQERRIREEWEEHQKKGKEKEERKQRAIKEKENAVFRELEKAPTSKQKAEGDEPWHNPLAPKASTHNYGTEKDTVNCAFYLKTGACRFGERCSRHHPRPPSSVTLLIPSMYQDIRLSQTMLDEADHDIGLEYDDQESYERYKLFFDDVLPEFEQAGKVVQFKVCCNYEPHLRGNVYVQFSSEEECSKAFASFNGRWYAQRQLSCEFSPVTRWRSAICGLFKRNRCPRGKNCNFLHVYRNPGNAFRQMDIDRDEWSPGRTSYSERGSERRTSRDWRRESQSREGSVRESSYRDWDRVRDRRRDLGRDRSFDRDRDRNVSRDRDWEREREREWDRRRDRDKERKRDETYSRSRSRDDRRRDNDSEDEDERYQNHKRRDRGPDRPREERTPDQRSESDSEEGTDDKKTDRVSIKEGDQRDSTSAESDQSSRSPSSTSRHRKRKHRSSNKHRHHSKSKKKHKHRSKHRRKRDLGSSSSPDDSTPEETLHNDNGGNTADKRQHSDANSNRDNSDLMKRNDYVLAEDQK